MSGLNRCNRDVTPHDSVKACTIWIWPMDGANVL